MRDAWAAFVERAARDLRPVRSVVRIAWQHPGRTFGAFVLVAAVVSLAALGVREGLVGLGDAREELVGLAVDRLEPEPADGVGVEALGELEISAFDDACTGLFFDPQHGVVVELFELGVERHDLGAEGLGFGIRGLGAIPRGGDDLLDKLDL